MCIFAASTGLSRSRAVQQFDVGAIDPTTERKAWKRRRVGKGALLRAVPTPPPPPYPPPLAGEGREGGVGTLSLSSGPPHGAGLSPAPPQAPPGAGGFAHPPPPSPL